MCSFAGRQLSFDGIANQRVNEPIPADLPGAFDQLTAQDFVQRLEEIGAAAPLGHRLHGRRQQLLIEFASDQRRRTEHHQGLRSDRLQSALQDLRDAVAERQRIDRLGIGSILYRSHHLTDEQCISGGAPMYAGGKVSRNVGAKHRLEVSRDVFTAQSRERDRIAVPSEVAEQGEQLCIEPGFDRPVRADEKNRQFADLGKQMLEKGQRRVVRPMQIIENDQQRPFAGCPA